MKKFLSLALIAAMLLSCVVLFASCDSGDDFKLGVICLHDEDSTYDLNFINGVKEAQKALGLRDDQVIIKRNIPESNEVYEAAKDLVDEGCDVIFANSFGHETHLLKAAKEFPEVEFCHATGTMAHTENLPNFHNAFASIYEGRYLAGVAAGLKLNEMIAAGQFTAEEAKIGYVGAYPYEEVISSYTSFYLGAKSVCPTVTMDVLFTDSWYDVTAEKNAAMALIFGGCKLISQHSDSIGAPVACEVAGIPNVSYNGSTLAYCPNTFIVSSSINWAPYFRYICTQAMNGEAIATDWTGTLATGSIVLSDVNTAVAAEGTQALLVEIAAKLISGEIHVFDTDTFTVNGMKLTSYIANVDTDADYYPDTQVIWDGYFRESEFRSAPYFDIKIDGISLLNW